MVSITITLAPLSVTVRNCLRQNEARWLVPVDFVVNGQCDKTLGTLVLVQPNWDKYELEIA